ncbi:MAG: cobaltochelatase subunit CobN [Pseudomonadota bacterium]
MKVLYLSFILTLIVCANIAHAEDYKVLFLSGPHSNKAKVSLFNQAAKKTGVYLDSKSTKSFNDLALAEKTFKQYPLVIFYGVSERDYKANFNQYAPIVKKLKQQNHNTQFTTLKWLEAEHLRKNVSKDEAQRIQDYFGNGGAINLARLGHFLRYRIIEKNNKPIEPPIIYPQVGIYHPDYNDKIFSDLASYLTWQKTNREEKSAKKHPVIGLLIQRSLIEADSTDVIDTAIRKFEKKGSITVPFFFELSPRSSDYTHLLKKDGEVFIDIIANFRSIHWASQRKKEFEALGVPVVQALTYFGGDQQHWEESTQGIAPGMTPFQLVLPESAGVIDPIIVATRNRDTGQAEVIDYQLDFFVNKLTNYANLKYKNNQDKKITVMMWGNRDVGASFMNVPESLRSISQALNQDGYNIPAVDSEYFSRRVDKILSPFYRSYELDALLEDDLAELMPLEEYLGWFNQLPEKVRSPINNYWGQAKNNFMVVEKEGEHFFVIPRIRNGNMLAMRQPPRAENEEDDKRFYHKATIPMNHYYLAAYFYARQYWNSDAIIHLGTHGSHEYLPGKERGLSVYDQSNLATWDTPVIYPFIVDDVGEAMQAKRRGNATIIAHMTPPFAAAGLQGAIGDIHELMHQYKSLDEGGVKEKTATQIINACFEQNICDDIDWTKDKIHGQFNAFLEALHAYMDDLSVQNQPLGLHSFGELPEKRLVISTLIQMLGLDFSREVAQYEQTTKHHHHDGHSHSHNHQHDHDHIGDDGHFHSQDNDAEIENIAGYSTIQEYVIAQADFSRLPENLRNHLTRGRQYYNSLIGIKEHAHLVNALNGQYIPVKTGGDPIRHPESLATGYNLYGFDPSRVPTKAAYEQGKELTTQLINDYYEKHGRYPTKLAFSLWSMETMRHYGVLEAQALYAMGVRPIWRSDGRVMGTEIIPANELKRPRVDIVLSATGLYRDAFPNVMQWLAKAIRQITELKEANNSLWDNTQRLQKELMTSGIAPEEAEYLSSVRIFSNESGNYGSGLGDSTIASDTWEKDDKLADLYLSRMGYFYGEDNENWGQASPEGLNLYAKQLSGTDIALFSRSSNVYGMLSSDDPFQYFGGLALAIRNIDGKSPDMLISNLRDAKNPKAEGADIFLAKELRTRNFHPRWVKEMKKEGYSGAVTMAASVSNFFGWQVMDPNLIRDDQWQEFYEIYINDKLQQNLNEWFEEVAPQAQARIIERMLEATRKAYWDASSEVVENLIKRYEELVNSHDLVVDNEKLREFIKMQAAGFGVSLSLPAPEVPASVVSANASAQPVEGQKLEKVEQTSQQSERDFTVYWIISGCLLIFLLGFARQSGVLPFTKQI